MTGALARRIVAIVLIAITAPAAAQGVQTRWARSPAACDGEAFTREETPLIVEGLSIRWFSFACTVVSSYKVAETLFLQARCASGGASSTIPVMLEPAGEKLRLGWNREPLREMQRCRWSPELGYH
ncbi:MAG: hypothetical protein ACRECO_02385 [Xanthobacteraceae bacterium]